jgi:exonuclease III
MRGLRNREKRRSIFSYLKNQKAIVYLLQETFSNPTDEKIWSAEWGGQIFYSHGSDHSKGVCVLIKPNYPVRVEIVELDMNGRFIILRLRMPGGISLNVVNVYAHTDHREQIDFINSLSTKITTSTDTSNLIIAGDWNTTLNSLDKQGGLTWKETRYRNSLVYFIKEANLVDIYRKIHPKNKSYTYKSKALKLKSRLDFFLISGKFQPDITKVETRASIARDYKAVFLSMNLNDEFKRGPGLWKFNNTLLQHESAEIR